MRISTKELVCLAVLGSLAVFPAQPALTISLAKTSNVTCMKSVCTATAADAVMNVTHLQNLLNKVNRKLVSGSVAGDIVIAAPLTWSSTHTLTLDSYRSVIVNKPMSVTGTGGLTILTNDGGGLGGLFSFGSGANIVFWDLSSKLTIDGWSYTLVDDWATFVQTETNCGITHIALAAGIDAGATTYSAAPIQYSCGTTEGLGNTISNLTIAAVSSSYDRVGLFGSASGVIENIRLSNIQITGSAPDIVGGLVGVSNAQISGVSVSGSILFEKIKNRSSIIGGLVGWNGFEGTGVTIDSHSSATVQGSGNIGGLAGDNDGLIRNSSATGAVHSGAGLAGGLVGSSGTIWGGIIDSSYATGTVIGGSAGGLICSNENTIINSYATGEVKAGPGGQEGGLACSNGSNPGSISSSYATGAVGRAQDRVFGGLVGEDDSPSGYITASYWDVTTSGTKKAVGIGSASGITGLTTVQLQSGLPAGFDPAIWAENPSINGGLPYLISNPPT
jgi:hypothetical protein